MNAKKSRHWLTWGITVKSCAILCVAFLLAGCSGIEMDTPDETRLTGDYHYLWDYDSTPPVLNIGRRTHASGYSILIQNVVSYGWTNDFIIAKCRLPGADNADSYAILAITHGETAETVFDELSYEEYLKKRAEFGIPDDVIFTRNYE